MVVDIESCAVASENLFAALMRSCGELAGAIRSVLEEYTMIHELDVLAGF